MSENTLLEDLTDKIREQGAVFIVGAGITVGATENAACASWKGLLHHGKARCQDVVQDLPDGWAERVRGEIDSGDLEDMLAAAEKISSKLRAPGGGEWRRWLREAIGELTVKNREVLEALHDLGVPLATTNYDNLLTEVTGYPPVTWREGAKVERVLRGDDNVFLVVS